MHLPLLRAFAEWLIACMFAAKLPHFTSHLPTFNFL